MNNKCFCDRPFTEIEIHTTGHVYTCCPDYFKKFYYIGNINKVKSFDEIWYSKRAKELRKSILTGTYKHCKLDICNMQNSNNLNILIENPPYPTLVRFSYDTQCNLNCIFCRDKNRINSDKKNKKYDKLIDKLFIPILKNAQTMSITSAGEITASNHSKKLLKRAAEIYPNLKFELLTNGLFFNESFCNELGIENRIERIVVSMHSIQKDTHEKIMRGINHEIVMKNLDFLLKQRDEGKIKEICLIFVALSLNYKEIPEFLEYARKNKVTATIWEYRHRKTKIDKKAKDYEVWKPRHPKYNDFVDIINVVKENYQDICRIPDLFLNLEKIDKDKLTFIEKIKLFFR